MASKTIGDWEREIKVIPVSSLEQWANAIRVLENWPSFKEAFGWTGLFTLATIIETELTIRRSNAR